MGGLIKVTIAATLKDTLAEIGAEDIYIEPGTETRTCSSNCGQLYSAWIMAKVGGSWYAIRVWDADIGERWVLYDPQEQLCYSRGQVAYFHWRLGRARLNSQAYESAIRDDAANHVVYEAALVEERREIGEWTRRIAEMN